MRNIFLIICTALLMASCSQDDELKTTDIGKGSVVLKMEVNNKLNARAAEDGDNQLNENNIDNLHILIFPQNSADNQQCLYYESILNVGYTGTGTLTKQLMVQQNVFNLGSLYDIYVIANKPSSVTLSSTMTLGALKSQSTITLISPTAAQANFVMDGKTSAILNPTQPTSTLNVSVSLKRAASKIRAKFVFSPSLAIASATQILVSLRHYSAASSLLDGFPLAYPTYINTSYVSGAPTSTFLFYCYESNWGISTSNDTYLMVNIPYGTVATNYYRVPINKYAENVATGRIERNMIYDVTTYIDRLGTNNEQGTTDVTGNYTITDWTSKNIVLKTVNQHYLGINEYNIIMPNISTYTISYVSDLPVSVTGITASCVQYSTSGSTSTINYTSGQSQFPVFTVNSASSTITINSTIPINYVPKNMTFTVTNNQGLSLNATIVQYPSRYVTARLSSGNVRPEWFTNGTNLNLFTVNTLVPSSDGSYVLGDPTNGGAKTDSTVAGNKVVSPRFIIASQYGVYSRVSYTVAQERCFQYGEDIYRSGWRMPTKAEIELINRIQDDPNSAVKSLLAGDAYWSAYKFDYYNFTNNSWVISNSSGTAFIRAVYDLYKYEQ